MSMNELPPTRQAHQPRGVCVLIAVDNADAHLGACVQSVRANTPDHVHVAQVAPTAAGVNVAIEQLAPADVIVLDEPCQVSPGWLARLCGAANADTNTASASALADAGTALAPGAPSQPPRDPGAPAEELAESVPALYPRLSRAVGPCVYVRRDALQLVGPLDEQIDLRSALEVDFAQRCVLSGLTHVAADDVLVRRLDPAPRDARTLSPALLERYPYLAQTPLADSAVLRYALRHASEPAGRLSVTLDARALDGTITGTHVHVLELILALVATDAVALRLLVHDKRLDDATRQQLSELPHTTLLDAEALDPGVLPTAVFHRPQQTFSPGDVALALALGESFVISQLDLIAYRNPGYFTDASTWGDFRAASRHGLSAAERVVVFSAHTRDELLSDALVDATRLRIVPPGLDHRTAMESRRPGALVEDPDSPEFLLCLGTDFRHKNRVFALRMLAALRKRHCWSGRLVFAGTHVSPGSSEHSELAFLAEHPQLAEAIVDLGAVGEREKTWLIEHAGAVLYPSAYEGFGLVPFESALLGTPCAFAPQASLAEVAPPETATIAPWDDAASADRTFALLSDPGQRESNVQALASRASGLSWDATARAMVEIYREAAAAPVRDSATLSRDLVRREARLSVQHDEQAAQLVREREHAQRMYDELNAQVGFGLGLIGPRGLLPENAQRALLALAGRPALARPLFAALAGVFVLMRKLARAGGASRRPRG